MRNSTSDNMLDLQNTAFCVLDVETTGLNFKKDRICEIAFVITTAEKVIHTADTFVDPGMPIPAVVSKIHGIFDKDVVGAPTTFPYGIKLPPRDCYVAHNARFDSSFLPALSRKPWLCTRRLAKRVLPGMKSYGNQALRHALELDVEMPEGGRPHRALPDALVTAAILRHLLAYLPEGAPTTLEGLVDWCNEPSLLTTCYFGKQHRGKAWSEVPREYLQWMESNCTNLDVDIRHTVTHYLEKSSAG
jgi:exodeoxyribonuclease X